MSGSKNTESCGNSFFGGMIIFIILIVLFSGKPDLSEYLRVIFCQKAGFENCADIIETEEDQ